MIIYALAQRAGGCFVHRGVRLREESSGQEAWPYKAYSELVDVLARAI